jgi:hypothetical protein
MREAEGHAQTSAICLYNTAHPYQQTDFSTGFNFISLPKINKGKKDMLT